MSNTFNDN